MGNEVAQREDKNFASWITGQLGMACRRKKAEDNQ